MILKYAELSSEVQSTVLSLLKERNKPEEIEGERTQTGATTPLDEQDSVDIGCQSVSPRFAVGGELQKMEETLTESLLQKENIVGKPQGEKIEGVTVEAVNRAASGETATIIQEVEEKKPSGKQKALQGYSSLEKDTEGRKEMEEVLEQIEKSFSEMSLDEQEEIMPRYTKLKIFLCKDRIETDASCIKCLINETIDCPLFKPQK
jgi:vacuolar-type H+-ATPase subunit H